MSRGGGRSCLQLATWLLDTLWTDRIFADYLRCYLPTCCILLPRAAQAARATAGGAI
jgi:hypothetical protein